MPQATVHATPLPAESPVTFAVICTVPFAGKEVTPGGGTLTVIPGTLKFADTGIAPPAAAVAVMVTVKSPAGGLTDGSSGPGISPERDASAAECRRNYAADH